ncbi:hypothetical protein PR048_003558 [Dryococelus australis]|uniref:CDT1 Geminin-binding domain-containing protein n=1 Tax=Dryococelus australis TaxID=614101 RepID=A0ABQ9INF9_9NEOP|nr:hypothetical protein PR048_003558 [Dryococelus australis]
MSQVTITNYFSKRKRQADDLKKRAKILVLDHSEYSFKCLKTDVDDANVQSSDVKVDAETLSPNLPNVTLQSSSAPAGKQKVVRFDESKNTNRVNVFQKRSSCKSTKVPKYDIRKSFLKASAKIQNVSNCRENDNSDADDDPQPRGTALLEEAPRATAVLPVPENAVVPTEPDVGPELGAGSSGVDVIGEAGFVTPTKKVSQLHVEESQCATAVLPKKAVVQTEPGPGLELGGGSSGADVQGESSLMTPTKKISQDLSLSEIKSRLSRSEKLRAAISSFSKASARCAQLEAARKKLDKAGPQLQNFDKVEVEFCTRYAVKKVKVAVKSPEKRAVGSPLKASSLSLPFSYRGLAEVFRCVDVVVSMLYNRSEAVTFKKIKAAVQEMLHRTFTEKHLGQIKAVFPDAYIFHQEKVRNFGSTSKADSYELTITPALRTRSEEEILKQTDKVTMTPTCILERKRSFYNNLVERVFEQHEKFLSSLDPPLVILRGELVRWHPQFEIDTVEEITPHELPQPPNVKKFTSARDVLHQAKDLFSCNPRMQSALQEMGGSVSQNGSQSSVSSEKEASPSKQESLHSGLKGIPKSLLEKVRARQAAKARLVMTCPTHDQESIEHSRLPELARILRNMFVTEKKAALPLELAILKLQNSYREKLSARELEHHIRLMVDLLPGWIAIHSIRNSDYLKLSRNGDITKVIQKLEATALEKNNKQALKPA